MQNDRHTCHLFIEILYSSNGNAQCNTVWYVWNRKYSRLLHWTFPLLLFCQSNSKLALGSKLAVSKCLSYLFLRVSMHSAPQAPVLWLAYSGTVFSFFCQARATICTNGFKTSVDFFLHYFTRSVQWWPVGPRPKNWKLWKTSFGRYM